MVHLSWGARITADLGPPTLFYTVSQAALAIEVRADDAQARALCRTINHWPTEWACFAERLELPLPSRKFSAVPVSNTGLLP